ncbi:MAG: hypothetical protein LC804_27080 [Acidobacteria bacterium]|nr:hypothetical protein [Acidobacteriota bacterium]
MRSTLISALFLSAVSAYAQQTAPEIDSIRKEDMRADLFFLASDTMRGRLTDTHENKLAAEWIGSRFERLGLKPAADDNSYYHKYNLMTATLGGAASQITVVETSASSDAGLTKAGQDFYPLRFSASAKASGELVFAASALHRWNVDTTTTAET